MQLFTKEGILLLVQLDHIDGELLGDSVQMFYDIGAKNVHLINTTTKKNRPGYLLLIDSPKDRVETIEKAIIQDLGASGWHRINTAHRHTELHFVQKELEIVTKENTYRFTAIGKVIGNETGDIRPEFENCKELQTFLYEREKSHISLRRIRVRLRAALQEDKNQCDLR